MRATRDDDPRLTHRRITTTLLCTIALALASTGALAGACTALARNAGWTPPAIHTADGDTLMLDALVARLAAQRVVLIGEVHDRYEHHLNQLELICRLRAHGPIAIGLEFFDTTAQRALDDYVYRHGDLDRLLRESRWFERWGFDPRHYAPILRHAREHRIALVALNVPGDLVRRVARGGLHDLDAGARSRLPASIADASPAYRARLRAIFEQHPGHEQRDFEAFVAAQSLWDEGMAQRAAEHLLAHPEQRLVVLAGEGHVAYMDAIPQRLLRRVQVTQARVLQSRDVPIRTREHDYRLLSTQRELPPAGRLGLSLGPGTASVTGLAIPGAAHDAGLRVGDRLISVNGRRVKGLADLRLALWRRQPGEAVSLGYARAGTTQQLMFALQ